MAAPARPPFMRRLAIALTIAVGVSACAQAANPSSSGGVRGKVTAGPQCPVVSQASPCPDAPWIGTVRATAEDGTAYEDQTDDQGRYEISLPPGVYVVVPVTSGGTPPTGEPQTVQVAQGQPLDLNLAVDTGIR